MHLQFVLAPREIFVLSGSIDTRCGRWADATKRIVDFSIHPADIGSSIDPAGVFVWLQNSPRVWQRGSDLKSESKRLIRKRSWPLGVQVAFSIAWKAQCHGLVLLVLRFFLSNAGSSRT